MQKITQIGMTRLLTEAERPKVFKVIIDPIGNISQVIFCRKYPGIPGWVAGKPHYIKNDTPSMKRAFKASLAALDRGE